MAGSYTIQITVKSIKGICHMGHYEGQQYLWKGKTPDGMCSSAYLALSSYITTLMYGGILPHWKDPDVMERVCPDGQNLVTFELRRLRE